MKVTVKRKKNGGTLKQQNSGVNNWNKANLKVTPRKTDCSVVRSTVIPRRVQRRA